MGVSNNKLINTLYPDKDTFERIIVDSEDLITRTQEAIDKATAEREKS